MKYIAGTAPDGAKIRQSANQQAALRAGQRQRCQAAATTAAAEDGGRGRAPIPRNQARENVVDV